MPPQSSVLILAPIVPGRIDELRRLLDGLNRMPGLAAPANPRVPFRQLERLHLARFAILEDPTPDDIAVYGLPPAPFRPTLAFFADCDGSEEQFLAEFAQRAEAGLRSLFSCCVGFSDTADLLRFMRQHRQAPAASSRQFEFVQNAWMIGTKFDGLLDESDPLLGNREAVAGCPAADAFTYARHGSVRRRLRGLPQFVTMHGGAYFFLPGIRALRYLATLGG
jgi:hypothetical protein